MARAFKIGDGHGSALLSEIVVPMKAACPQCKRVSWTRICPKCHEELLPFSGHCTELNLGVIGAKEAGKSHYITALIREIDKSLPDSIGVLHAANDETMRRYRQDFYDPVYRSYRTIEATRSATVERKVRRPLTYYLRIQGHGKFARLLGKFGLNGRDRSLRDVVMNFFDTAGEDLNSEDLMRVENKYIYNSGGLILLLDPLQLDAVRERVPKGTRLPNPNTETREIVDRTVNLIRRARSLAAGHKIEIPIALAFSKCDALRSLLPTEHPINQSAWIGDRFDMHDYARIRENAELKLREWGAGELVNRLCVNFQNHGLFFVSSLGCSPDADGRIPKVQPYRVLDPLLWILAVKGFIRSSS